MKIRNPLLLNRPSQLILAYRPGTADDAVIGENVLGKQYTATQNLTKDDVWLDGGAHIGTFSVMIAPYVKRVIAVEPAQETYDLLMENVMRNGGNVETIKAAIVENDDLERDLYFPASYPYYNSAVSVVPVSGRFTRPTPCVNINDLIRDYGINKLKLDIEGVEATALLAITDDLWAQITDLHYEWHFGLCGDLKRVKFYEMLEYLKSKGFYHMNPRVMKKQWFMTVHMSKTPPPVSE